jgi:cytochrome c oxidase subunit IV
MGHDPHDHSSPEYLKKQSNLIWLIGGILIFGTVFTVWIAGVDLGSHACNIGIGLLVATIKASLVGLIFMHLKGERGLIYKFLVFTIIFVIGLFFLTYLHWSNPLFKSYLFK